MQTLTQDGRVVFTTGPPTPRTTLSSLKAIFFPLEPHRKEPEPIPRGIPLRSHPSSSPAVAWSQKTSSICPREVSNALRYGVMNLVHTPHDDVQQQQPTRFCTTLSRQTRSSTASSPRSDSHVLVGLIPSVVRGSPPEPAPRRTPWTWRHEVG